MIENLPVYILLYAFAIAVASAVLVLTALLVAWGVRTTSRILGPTGRGRHARAELRGQPPRGVVEYLREQS